MSTSSTPLKGPRLVALFMSFAWGIIALAVVIHARVQSDHDTKALQAFVPPGFRLNIDSDDVDNSGTVIGVVSGVIAILSLIYMILILIGSRIGRNSSGHNNLDTRSLPFQSISLGFLAVWLFATQIAFTVFFANREAQVTVTAGGLALPSNVIEQLEQSLGASPVYRHLDYLRLVAILPWFTILFTVIAAVLSFMASRRRGVKA